MLVKILQVRQCDYKDGDDDVMIMMMMMMMMIKHDLNENSDDDRADKSIMIKVFLKIMLC